MVCYTQIISDKNVNSKLPLITINLLLFITTKYEVRYMLICVPSIRQDFCRHGYTATTLFIL